MGLSAGFSFANKKYSLAKVSKYKYKKERRILFAL
jgi:hypothetical protein